MQVGVLLASLGCDPGPSAEDDDGGSAGSASSATTAPAVGCGDGIHESGEVCYERVETGLSNVRVYGVSIARNGTMEDALAIDSLPDVGLDTILELWQVRDGVPGAITQPLLVPEGEGISSYATVDVHGDGEPEIVARSATAFTIFSLDGDTLVRRVPVESNLQDPYSGSFFLPGDVDGDGKQEVFFKAGWLARLSEDGVEVLAEVPLGGCGTLRAGQAADFNDDGLVDFVGLGSLDGAGVDCAGTDVYDPVGHRATVVLGKTDPQALEVSHVLEPQVVPIDVIAGDYDGDDIVDLAFAGPDGARIFLGLGDGSFGEGIILAPDIGAENQLSLRHAVDVDGDGADELVVVIVGDNSFSLVDDVVGEPSVRELAASDYYLLSASADFNNDDIPDFALYRGRTVGLWLLVSNP